MARVISMSDAINEAMKLACDEKRRKCAFDR